MNADGMFCSLSLKLARREAAKFKVNVKGLSTCRDSSRSGYSYYEVYQARPRPHVDAIVWEGEAWNSADAKAKAISYLVQRDRIWRWKEGGSIQEQHPDLQNDWQY